MEPDPGHSHDPHPQAAFPPEPGLPLPLTLLTLTGIAVLTVIPFTPLGAALGFVALPAAYFAYLIPCILLYMVLATSLKKAYVRHYGELL